jgi:hypothetical protein
MNPGVFRKSRPSRYQVVTGRLVAKWLQSKKSDRAPVGRVFHCHDQTVRSTRGSVLCRWVSIPLFGRAAYGVVTTPTDVSLSVSRALGIAGSAWNEVHHVAPTMSDLCAGSLVPDCAPSGTWVLVAGHGVGCRAGFVIQAEAWSGSRPVCLSYWFLR